jgi:outer membrane protein OmpA-like peptidoglycan-associated protein
MIRFFGTVLLVFCVTILVQSQQAPIAQSSQGKTLGNVSEMPSAVKTRIKQGDNAFEKEAYAAAYDKYLRALSFVNAKDTASKAWLNYKIGRSQFYLNHHKNACDYYKMVWDDGYRDFQFLKEYANTLLIVGRLNDFDKVVSAINIKDSTISILKASAELVRTNRNGTLSHTLSMSDIHPMSQLNTAFSDYGVGLFSDKMVFSSSRFILGANTKIDPGTGQGYSHLYSATYDAANSTYVNPTLLKGEFPIDGNIGTFSFDAAKNIAYFMWSMDDKNGIYTLSPMGDRWAGISEFQFNYKQGGTIFGGHVGHPSISPNGNRLLFTVKDLDRGSSTDIWIVEKAPQTAKSTRRTSRVSNPKQTAKQAAPQTRKPKKGEKASSDVIINSEWGMPYRYGAIINTSQTESFPQWLDDNSFVFSSNGKVGFGGLDMYMVKLGKDYKEVKSVEHLPPPINSSFDDHSFVYDKTNRAIIFSSNRPTKYGITDNLYMFKNAGAVVTISGRVYDSISRNTLAPYMVLINGDTALPDYRGIYNLSRLPAGVFVITASAEGYVSRTDTINLDSISSILPIVVAREVNFGLLKEAVVSKSTYITRDETSPANPQQQRNELQTYRAPVEQPKEPVEQEATYQPSYSAPVEQPKEPVEQEATYQPSYSAPVTSAEPVQPQTVMPQPIIQEPATPQAAIISNPDQMPVKQPVQKQDLSRYMNDNMSAKQIVDAVSKNRRDISTVDQRSVDEYRKRVSDPTRRSSLQVLPADAVCEACSETVKRRNIGEPFYVSSGDDKTLITLTNPAGQRTYLDLAPNTNYGIDVKNIDSKGNMSSLPKNIDISDIRKTVVTKDYVVYECAPKLSELNDETYVNNLYFDFDKDSLIKDATRELDRMIIIALKNPKIQVEVSAHADERGADAYNKNLTDRRLDRAISYLERKGFDTDRIKGKSYGKSSPIVINASTEDEHRLNRRVTFKLVFPFAKNVKQGDATYQVTEAPLKPIKGLIFRVQLGAFKIPLNNPLDFYYDVFRIDPTFELSYYMDVDGLYKYNVGGDYFDIEEARKVVRKLLGGGRECYVAAFYNGERITVSEAMVIMNKDKKR